MQIGGLGSGHSASDHHVTNCIHDHHELRDKIGSAAMKASASGDASAANVNVQMEGQFSLSAWMKNMLGNGRGFLLNFWEGGEAVSGTKGNQTTGTGAVGNQVAVTGVEGSQTVTLQGTAQVDAHMAAAASVTVQPPIRHQGIRNSHYFSTVEDTGNQKQTLWQKMKVRFHNVSGRLSGRLPQKFFSFQAKNSFQAKQEKPKEDLRRHSRYREDTVEIDCILTDDSYLMDSYDRKGEYTTLTTKK